MSHTLHQLHLECLAASYDLETFWTYYDESDGRIFAKEYSKAADAFFHEFDRIPNAIDALRTTWTQTGQTDEDLQNTIAALRNWGAYRGDFDLAFGELPPLLTAQSIRTFFIFLRWDLFDFLGVSKVPGPFLNHFRLHEGWIKWRAHLPRLNGECDPDEVMTAAAKTKSIVVVGDIRSSQDLMTYGEDPKRYSICMVQFISIVRRLIEKHGGFFDKFTGDGFIAYFNEEICKHHGTGRNESFLAFTHECREQCKSHFDKWTARLRKLPGRSVGLALGADIGNVAFPSYQHHVMAFGDAIVWATRMSAGASAEEVFVNNLLYQELRQDPKLRFKKKTGETKSGESFQAWSMKFKDPPPAANQSPSPSEPHPSPIRTPASQ